MTSSQPTNINYISTYFQIAELTKIHGEPTFETLKTLYNQIKANSGSVTTHLGGGAHGYLSYLLSPSEYNRIAPDTPFACPLNPGPLVVPPSTAQHAATRLSKDHKESLRVFRECLNVKEALKKQVIEVIDPKWKKYLRSRLIQRVNPNLEALFQTLFQRYGFVTQGQLGDFEKEVRGYQYNLWDPLTLVFDLIDKLQLMGEAADTPFTEVFALEILQATGDFQDDIKAWNRRAATNYGTKEMSLTR